MSTSLFRGKIAAFFVLILSFFCSISVHAAEWPEVFEPTVLRTLYIEMTPADWQAVQDDLLCLQP